MCGETRDRKPPRLHRRSGDAGQRYYLPGKQGTLLIINLLAKLKASVLGAGGREGKMGMGTGNTWYYCLLATSFLCTIQHIGRAGARSELPNHPQPLLEPVEVQRKIASVSGENSLPYPYTIDTA